MSKYTKAEIYEIMEEEDVEFVRLQFCDVTGKLKNLAIHAPHLKDALENGWRFEGSKINEDGEPVTEKMRLIPDLDTFEILPFRPQSGKVARLICDIQTYDGKAPFEQDSRRVLRNEIAKAAEKGFCLTVGPECEFFLFNCDDEGKATTKTNDWGTTYDVGPRDQGENVRRDIIENLSDMSFDVLSSYHEFSRGQHEIDFKHKHALRAADMLLTFKMTVKAVAKSHGYHATFMPKPLSGCTGSGMHLNMALEDAEGKNLFFDPDDPKHLSKIAYQFMAGIEAHIQGITAISNPLVNSYKRLCAEMDAPSFVTWSGTCYDSLIQYLCTDENTMRIELRSPDGCANPYLTLALCLAAGMDGIERKLELPPETTIPENKMTASMIAQMGIKHLPKNLDQALDALQADELLCNVLGDEILNAYIKMKRKECEDYNRFVSKWEIDNYLEIY